MTLLKILRFFGPQHSHPQDSRSDSLPENASGSTYSAIFQGTQDDQSPAVSETEGQTVTCLPVYKPRTNTEKELCSQSSEGQGYKQVQSKQWKGRTKASQT